MFKINSSSISPSQMLQYSSSSLAINIEESTIENPYYRRVIFTNKFQLVLMTLKPGEIIPREIHYDVDQFIRVESGNGKIILDKDSYSIKKDSAIAIHSGTYHEIINTGNENLSLYVIYSSPLHDKDEIDCRQPDQE